MAKDPIARRYLRVLEPWEGGHTPYDTGLGNRLLHWDACYLLCLASGQKHFLELETRYWLELQWFELPGVRQYDVRHMHEFSQHWLSTFDLDHPNDKITKLPGIGNAKVEEFLATGKLELPEPRYYFKFDWKYVKLIHEKAKELKMESGLKRLKIKNRDILRAIQAAGNAAVGVHVRRGNGVWKSEKDYKELPPSVKENVEYQALPDTIYKYWNDAKYISVMKEMLQIKSDQKFYLSCDLLDHEYKHLKDKYPGKIITRRDVIKKLPEELIKNIRLKDPRDRKRVALESVIDMLVLSYCNFIIAAPHSTWLDSILRMKDISWDTVNAPKDRILEAYEKVKDINALL